MSPFAAGVTADARLPKCEGKVDGALTPIRNKRGDFPAFSARVSKIHDQLGVQSPFEKSDVRMSKNLEFLSAAREKRSETVLSNQPMSILSNQFHHIIQESEKCDHLQQNLQQQELRNIQNCVH